MARWLLVMVTGLVAAMPWNQRVLAQVRCGSYADIVSGLEENTGQEPLMQLRQTGAGGAVFEIWVGLRPGVRTRWSIVRVQANGSACVVEVGSEAVAVGPWSIVREEES